MLKKNMKLGKFSIFVILCFFLSLQEVKAGKKYSTDLNDLDSNSIIVDIKALDKITAKIFDLSIKIGEEKIFGNLKIKPLKCKNTNINSLVDTVAYLQVKDTSVKTNDQVFVFNGWTFASNPSLRPLDHPIYDLWLVGCRSI